MPATRRLVPAAIASLLANVGIVLTGGMVRVTGSGLGCPRWPTCDGSSIIPTGEASGLHSSIEFGNRLLTFLVLATAVWIFLEARGHADQLVRRLAAVQPAGVVAQALLGGVTVLTGLHPLWVAAHFLLSALLIAAATVLHVRVTVTPEPVPAAHRRLALALTSTASAVLVLGTLVTAAGPHAGDPGTARLGFDIRTIAVAHADAVWLTVGLTLALLVASEGRLRRATAVLLAIELFQGGIGYLQYALGIPAWIVALHLLGATSFWVGVIRVASVAGYAGDSRPWPKTTASSR